MNIQQWTNKFYAQKKANPFYRLGQAFCNDFYDLHLEAEIKADTGEDLFYMSDDKQSLLVITNWIYSKPPYYFETLTEGM